MLYICSVTVLLFNYNFVLNQPVNIRKIIHTQTSTFTNLIMSKLKTSKARGPAPDKETARNSALLKEWYYSLSRPRDLHTTARTIICERCNISLRTFYAWISGETEVPHLAKQVINEVAGEKVFDVEPYKPFSISDINN